MAKRSAASAFGKVPREKQSRFNDLDATFDAAVAAWKRPSFPPLNPARDSISFQLVDADFFVPSKKSSTRSAVIRLYGVTMNGNSVMARVTEFRPYLYVKGWPEVLADPEGFRRTLDRALKDTDREKGLAEYVLRVESVKRQSAWGYQFGEIDSFLKITVALPSLCAVARALFEKGVDFGPLGGTRQAQTFESNIAYVLRFMVDRGVRGGAWVELPAGRFFAIPAGKQRLSNCQFEAEILGGDLLAHEPEGEWLKMAPLRILSFDIECAGRRGHFPKAEIDPVIQIANVVQIEGRPGSFAKNLFSLHACAPIEGAEVFSFAAEADLLAAWNAFVVAVDFDIITGYNILNFDLPYLLNRAETLRVPPASFGSFGRLLNSQSVVKKSSFTSKAFGTREDNEIPMFGRVQFDLMVIMRRDYKLRSYTLNAVSAHFLKVQKEDVHHSIITDLWKGTPMTRRRLGVYCLKDADLPIKLLNKLMCIVNYVEMARVTGVPLNFLLTRGQQIKVMSQLYRKCLERDLLIPVFKRGPATDEKYEGATVLDPIKGFYTVPIATLDFASLYPSIMMAHNLCYTTLVLNPEVDLPRLHAAGLAYTKTPIGDYFVKASAAPGLLPDILNELLTARTNAKRLMKETKDPFVKAVLNGRQLALKVSANSVYGFTGATVGQLPCLAISAGVTGFGREMIEATKQVVETTYTVANGYAADAVVVYGDTDSVMCKFGCATVAEAMALGKEAAVLATTKFIAPIKLEFEKVYFPYLLMNKKRYAGLYWTRPDKWDMMDTKGLETVRRDNCRFAQEVLTVTLNKILIDKDVKLACDYVKTCIRDLLLGKVDLSKLVISKSLSKSASAEGYANTQAHVVLAEKMRVRDAATAPVVGDRVPYVIIQGTKKAAMFEKVEDPMFVLKHNLPIDTGYYLEKQLRGPLTRFFEPIIGASGVHKLFSGEHTRSIKLHSSGKTAGGIMKFTVKTRTCAGCQAVLRKTEENLCPDCFADPAPRYMAHLQSIHEKEALYCKLWTNCQRCQGSVHQDVLCSNHDCPVFYTRKKVQQDLEAEHTQLKQFDIF